MIVRRYGESIHSVELNFDSKALNEIGFRRDRGWSVTVAEFEGGWERVEGYELRASAAGHVQDEAEQALLAKLEAGIRELLEGLGPDELLRVESEPGRDHPKTRHRMKNVVIEGENRLHFSAWVDPPLRIARYRRLG